MRVYVEPQNAPLKDVPKSLHAREVARFQQEAAELGIQFTGHGVDETSGVPYIEINISEMPNARTSTAISLWTG